MVFVKIQAQTMEKAKKQTGTKMRAMYRAPMMFVDDIKLQLREKSSEKNAV